MQTISSEVDRLFELNFLFQHAAEGILVTQADGYLTRLNPAAAAMLELNPDDVLGEHTAVTFRHRPDLIRLLNGDGSQQASLSLPHQRIGTALGMDRPVGGRIVLINDVTERKAVDTRRTALIRQLAHDLRNPLNAIDGYADLVSRFGALNDQQRKYLARVRETSQKLYRLAETLVDLAWVEAGMPLQHVSLEISQVIRAALENVIAVARDRQVTLVFSLQNPVSPVLGDPARIQQMIEALLLNAILYSRPESNVALHAWQDTAKVYCSVGDQGIGIAANELDKIWDRMWRSTDEQVRAHPGGGVGLTFARAILERHGGQIWAESEPDVGTVVTFWLPLAEEWH